MTAVHVTLQTYWQEGSGNPATHAQSEIACQDIERRYQVRLPDDFRAYLVEAAPKTDYWDRENVIWWSPDRIKNVPAEYEHEISDAVIAAVARKSLFFADYMIWCWAWAICCEEGEHYGKIAVVGGAPDRWIANSFTEFVEHYFRDRMFVVE